MKEGDKDWPAVSLEEACLKIQDGTHFSPKLQFSEPGPGRYKYITAKNIRPWGLDLNDVTYLNEETHRGIYRRCNPEFGDVLLTKDGVNTGMVAINTLDEEFSLLSSVALLKPRRDALDARYLRYFIESPRGSREIVGKMSGTAIRRIILRRIKEASIPLPPLDEQLRIVAEIEKQFTRIDAGMLAVRQIELKSQRLRSCVLLRGFGD
jgi:type I restriction enzyme, S subunit